MLAGCSGNSGSSETSGTRAHVGQLSLQLLFAPQAGSTSPSAGLASAQVRQVQPGDPGFLERLEVRLQAQGSDLVPLQVFPLNTAEQEIVTRDVTLPDTVPATFQVRVSSFTSQGIEVFRGDTTVVRGQDSAVVTLGRTALVPVPATPTNLTHTTFSFPDGTAFGLPNVPVTLALGTFTGNVGDFALVAKGLIASGQVTIGSCIFLVTASAFPPGQGPQVGAIIAIDPCQIDAINHSLIATNVIISATPTISSTSVPAPPESGVILPPPATLVTDEDTIGTALFTVSLTGNRPATSSLAITTPPEHGTATVTGPQLLVTYKPAPDFNGSDFMVVTVIVTFTDNNVPALLLGTVPIPITVRPVNDAPVVTNPGNQTTAEGQTVSLPLTASDPDGNPLTFSATNLPPGLSVNPTTGLISGTIAFTAVVGSPSQTVTVTVTVSDGTASASASFTWTVTNVNRPPQVTSPGNQTTAEGQTVSLPLTASDPDGNLLTFSATGLPPGLRLNATGLISGTVAPGAAAGSPYSVTVTVSDGLDNARVTFTWTVTAPSLPPHTVRIGSPSGPVFSGATFTVSVQLNADTTNVVSYLFELTFDPAVVRVMDIGQGSFLFETPITNPSAFASGTVRFAANNPTFAPANGVLTLANITFQVIGNPGNISPLTLRFPSNGVLVNSTFQAIGGITFVNSSVIVN